MVPEEWELRSNIINDKVQFCLVPFKIHICHSQFSWFPMGLKEESWQQLKTEDSKTWESEWNTSLSATPAESGKWVAQVSGISIEVPIWMQPVSAPTEDGRRNQFDLFLVGRNYGWQEVGYCSLINTEVFDNVENLMCEGKKSHRRRRAQGQSEYKH